MPHIHELYDFTVGVFIVYGDKVLLVYHPRYSKWLSPGGHIELNEDPEEALFREIQEETGLDVEILSIKPTASAPGTKHIWQPNYVDVHDAKLPHKHINFIYFAKSKNSAATLSDEHTKLRWFKIQDLRNKKYGLPPVMIFYAEQALRTAAS